MWEGQEPAIDIKDRLPKPSSTGCKLQPNASTTPVGVSSAVRYIDGVKYEDFRSTLPPMKRCRVVNKRPDYGPP
jgi:hypothetical protein